VAAAFGVCLAVRPVSGGTLAEALEVVRKSCDYLAASRPTAVNLFWALDRMRKAAEAFVDQNPSGTVESFKQRLLVEAHTICGEDKAMCEAIARNGEKLIPDGGAVLTHCNAGALATAGIGTALAPMYLAYKNGKRFRVYVDETRPLLQGARLTAWELTQAGIEAVLICDNMAASLMQAGKVNAIITGADRIAANGDAANKIGTLGLSILANHYGVPFYIAAPSSTFDLAIANGTQIPIEQRSADEVRSVGTSKTAPENVDIFNPAFDVTPAKNITAIITEKGVIESPNTEAISACLKK
jgi:methylthioribose-1-phosphate isomerase